MSDLRTLRHYASEVLYFIDNLERATRRADFPKNHFCERVARKYKTELAILWYRKIYSKFLIVASTYTLLIFATGNKVKYLLKSCNSKEQYHPNFVLNLPMLYHNHSTSYLWIFSSVVINIIFSIFAVAISNRSKGSLCI